MRGNSDRISEVASMRGGRIVESSPARRALESPGHKYTKSLLAAVPRVTRAA